MLYYVHHNNQKLGPFTDVEIKAKLVGGEFLASDYIWWEGQKEWVPLTQSVLASLSLDGILPTASGAIAKKNSSLAIAAIVFAFIGILFAPIQIGTIIMGHIALGEIKKNPNLKGRSMAITSLVIGYIYIFIIVACVLIAVSNQIWHWSK